MNKALHGFVPFLLLVLQAGFGWYLFSVSLASMPAAAASFDCSKARTEVEQIICSDKVLSRLDEQMTEAYNRASANAPDKGQLKKEQKKWLKRRNDECWYNDPIVGHGVVDPACLKTAYEFRIWALNPHGDPSNPLYAGRYGVGWGWINPVCRALTDHLNRHPELPEPVCRMVVAEGESEFSLPEWEVVDPRAHREILKQMFDEAGPRPWLMNKEQREERDQLFEKGLAAGEFKLSRSAFDVNSAGFARTVYRAELDPCDPKINYRAPRVPRLYAVGDDGKVLLGFGWRVLPSPPRDVFLYKGRAHLAWWSGDIEKGIGGLGVSENVTPNPASPGGFYSHPVCTLSFRR
jgi:hypothetical protein